MMMARFSQPFELMRRLVEGHELRSGMDKLTVVPVLVDDLATLMPLVRGSMDYLQGCVLDANGADLHAPVLGTMLTSLRGTVQSALVIKRPMGDEHVEIVDLADGRIDAQFVGSKTVTSGGERQILAIARSMFSKSAQESSIAVLAYDELAGMDGPANQACWRYLVEHLSGIRVGKLRTLIVIVRVSTVDFNRHCAFLRGFHFALLGGEFIRRRTDNAITATISLVTKRTAPHIVLFLGAGASASSGLPLGNTLRDDAIRRLIGKDTVDSWELAKEFREFLGNHEHLLMPSEQVLTVEDFACKLTLEQVVRVEKELWHGSPETLEVFHELHSRILSMPHSIGPGIRAIQRMAGVAGRRIAIVSVNFDTLVEHGHEELFEKFATEDEFDKALSYLDSYLAGESDRVPLLKVHGTIENRESCVASAEQTSNSLPAVKDRALMRLIGKGSKIPWIYVGASMRDTDLTTVFNRKEFAEGVHEIWVSPYLPPTVHEFAQVHRGNIWSKKEDLHSHSVTELADEFLRQLADAWY